MNFGGIIYPFKDLMCKILSPSNILVFLWLVTNNKILTRDNIAKRCVVDDVSCLLCKKQETVDIYSLNVWLPDTYGKLLSIVFSPSY